ncbi:MAG TPA: tetratricopeptide repeat protein [Blastocatellia bacterium]|nr:tetratricopeptide repeat protein [Blastocatellia bacterium]
MDRRASQESLVELIDSGQFLIAEERFSERRTDEPMEMVIRSEVATYFERLNEAGALLEEVAPRIADIHIAARFSLQNGRLALLHSDSQNAQTQLHSAYHFYLFLKDSFGVSRALLNLARLARSKGEIDDAAAKLEEAQSGIKGRTSKRSEYLLGIILTEQAAVAADRGESEKAADLYAEATRLLKNCEKGRSYARALIGMADLKCALGEFQDSVEIYKEANIVLERYDLKGDLADSQLKLAQALLRLKRLERAEKLAEESRAMRRGNATGESQAAAVLALIALQRGDLEAAEERVRSAVELSDQSPSIETRVRARIALGHVKLNQREFKEAAEALGEAAELARGLVGTPARRLELEATVYVAEAFHNVDTRAGRLQLARVSELLNQIDDAWLGDEFNRVSAKYEEQIVFTDDNRLVFDGNQLPRWQEAKRTLEGFLLRNALRQTSNSLTRAARKLGVSKVHVHNLKKKHGL